MGASGLWFQIFRGCTTWGYTEEEALKSIPEAAQDYIEAAQDYIGVLFEDGRLIPKNAPTLASCKSAVSNLSVDHRSSAEGGELTVAPDPSDIWQRRGRALLEGYRALTPAPSAPVAGREGYRPKAGGSEMPLAK